MNNKVDNAVKRLQNILPLEQNLTALSTQDINDYHSILRQFLEHGQVTQSNIYAASKLAELGFIVLNEENGITGAYPFTSEDRIHKVHSPYGISRCMCALDALAIAPMYELTTTVMSQCHSSRAEIMVQQDNKQIINPDELDETVFAINWNASCAATSCSDSLCGEMIFLRGENHIENWLNEDKEQREIFNLTEAVEFAAAFFKPLVD